MSGINRHVSSMRQGEDVVRCRRMISRLINLLERYLELAEGTASRHELDDAWLLGSRETVVSALARLVQMLEKVTQLEKQWQELREKDQGKDRVEDNLTPQEWNILLRYVEKFR